MPLGEHGAKVIELPAGLVGDDDLSVTGSDTDIIEAARRELIEETGFDANKVEIISQGPSSAGLCDEIITFVVARELEKVGAGGGVDGEDITTHLIPLSDVHAWLVQQAQRGTYIDPKVWAGIYLLQTAN